MENSVLNSLQLYKTKWFSGLVEENMLSNALMTKPHEVSTVLSYIFGRFDQGNIIDFITNGVGRTLQIENGEYEWNVMIEHDKAIAIKAAQWAGSAIDTASTSTSTPGINGTPIQVWLGEKWFGPGAVVVFDDRNFQARVTGEPYQDGIDWVYNLTIIGDPNSYIPPQLFGVGKQLSREGSAYEEYSEESDYFNYSTPFKLRNKLSLMRAHYDITGSALSSVMVIALRDPKTKKSTNYWADYQEWAAMRQWYERLDRWTMYSKFNTALDGSTNLTGTNGRPINIGAGLLQQISPSNITTYTTLTLDLIDQFLSDLSYNIKGFGDRKFLMLTGEMGMREFDRVLREKASSYTIVDSKIITGSGQELTLSGQFTTYKGLNGIELTVKHFPIYDNPVYNRLLHPISGKPVESYRMSFFDISNYDGEANLQKVVRKGRELVMWYTGGSAAPGQGFAKSIQTLRSNAKDGYTVHFLAEQGVMLKNPTTSGELILNVSSY
jgi:hypothetical protein